jgi:hypothetical protein
MNTLWVSFDMWLTMAPVCYVLTFPEEGGKVTSASLISISRYVVLNAVLSHVGEGSMFVDLRF